MSFRDQIRKIVKQELIALLREDFQIQTELEYLRPKSELKMDDILDRLYEELE